MKLLALIAVLIAVPRAAAADGEDRRARRMASEANLEPARRREGMAMGIALGAGMQVGFSEALDEASGTGGSINLRVGTSASDRLAWFVDYIQAGTPRDDVGSATKINRTTVLGVGLQLFALETLWLRGGGGLGHLLLKSEEGSDGKTGFYGLGMYGGGGIDFLRRGRFALSGEVQFVSGVYRDGFVSAVSFLLGATWW